MALPVGDDGRHLDDDARELYREVAFRHRGDAGVLAHCLGWTVERVERTAHALTSLRLLTWDHDQLTAIRPEHAAVAFLQLEQQLLTDRVASVEHTRDEILSLVSSFDAVVAVPTLADRPAAVVLDEATGRSLLYEELANARRRVLLVEPRPNDGVRATGLLERALDRELDVRALLAHQDRQAPGVRRWVGQLTIRGGAFRTARIELPWTVVVDDTLVALDSGSDRGLVVAADPTIVASLVAGFELSWTGAQAFAPGAAGQPDEQATMGALHLALIEQLANGRKDEQIARQVGLSVRTCRRHIATIMTALGATSRFQAGVVAAQRRFARAAPGSRRDDEG